MIVYVYMYTSKTGFSTIQLTRKYASSKCKEKACDCESHQQCWGLSNSGQMLQANRFHTMQDRPENDEQGRGPQDTIPVQHIYWHCIHEQPQIKRHLLSHNLYNTLIWFNSSHISLCPGDGFDLSKFHVVVVPE